MQLGGLVVSHQLVKRFNIDVDGNKKGRPFESLNFPGRDVPEQKFTVVSFPGKYEFEWDDIARKTAAAVKRGDLKEEQQLATACVFFPGAVKDKRGTIIIEASPVFGQHCGSNGGPCLCNDLYGPESCCYKTSVRGDGWFANEVRSWGNKTHDVTTNANGSITVDTTTYDGTHYLTTINPGSSEVGVVSIVSADGNDTTTITTAADGTTTMDYSGSTVAPEAAAPCVGGDDLERALTGLSDAEACVRTVDKTDPRRYAASDIYDDLFTVRKRGLRQDGPSPVAEESSVKAPWGCKWMYEWIANVEKASRNGQQCVVVYFEGKCGDNVNGLGNSQKGEVAWLEKMGIEYVRWDIKQFNRDALKLARGVLPATATDDAKIVKSTEEAKAKREKESVIKLIFFKIALIIMTANMILLVVGMLRTKLALNDASGQLASSGNDKNYKL
jgi:hypothetical protein